MDLNTIKKDIKKIVILTGAGISAESGIKTFRDANGLWENHPVEQVATYDGFEENPHLVHKFYNQRRNQLLNEGVLPNPAHLALGELFKSDQYQTTLVTQNIDNLHELGGAKPLHMHGELLKIECESCRQIFEVNREIYPEDSCHICNKAGQLRPYVVWFGEMPHFLENIYHSLRECDLFIAIGTSGQVYPAAQFVQEAKRIGQAYCIEINLEETNISRDFDEKRKGTASQLVPELVKELIG